MKNERLYLEHILEANQRVEPYTGKDKIKFMTDTLVQDGVIRNLQTLAESTQKISDTVKKDHPGVEWRAIAGFRNIMVHDYLGVDLDRVWGVVENRIPKLKEEIEKILREEKENF